MHQPKLLKQKVPSMTTTDYWFHYGKIFISFCITNKVLINLTFQTLKSEEEDVTSHRSKPSYENFDWLFLAKKHHKTQQFLECQMVGSVSRRLRHFGAIFYVVPSMKQRGPLLKKILTFQKKYHHQLPFSWLGSYQVSRYHCNLGRLSTIM